MNNDTKNQQPLPWIYFCVRGFAFQTSDVCETSDVSEFNLKMGCIHPMTASHRMNRNLLFHKFTKTIAGRGINDIINSGRQS